MFRHDFRSPFWVNFVFFPLLFLERAFPPSSVPPEDLISVPCQIWQGFTPHGPLQIQDHKNPYIEKLFEEFCVNV